MYLLLLMKNTYLVWNVPCVLVTILILEINWNLKPQCIGKKSLMSTKNENIFCFEIPAEKTCNYIYINAFSWNVILLESLFHSQMLPSKTATKTAGVLFSLHI